MKLNLTFFLAFVVLLTISIDGRKCKKECSNISEPVCARLGNPHTFKNKCILEHMECKTRDKFIIINEGVCPKIIKNETATVASIIHKEKPVDAPVDAQVNQPVTARL